jgi:hypothetical protein
MRGAVVGVTFLDNWTVLHAFSVTSGRQGLVLSDTAWERHSIIILSSDRELRGDYFVFWHELDKRLILSSVWEWSITLPISADAFTMSASKLWLPYRFTYPLIAIWDNLRVPGRLFCDTCREDTSACLLRLRKSVLVSWLSITRLLMIRQKKATCFERLNERGVS